MCMFGHARPRENKKKYMTRNYVKPLHGTNPGLGEGLAAADVPSSARIR